jgi:beta-lactamase superfamily II metal-dependent hydrolase
MDIRINMLNVKDGDAIIVELTKINKSLVMIIDGGEPNYYKTKMKPKLESVLKKHDKRAPDIVVCTHYDSDHIGGLIPLIEEYISEIQEVWIHKTPEILKGYIENAIQILNEKQIIEQKGRLIPSFELFKFNKLFESHEQSMQESLNEKANLIIESLPQLKRLIDMIPPAKLKEVFHKQRPLAEWQEIVILGPTKQYYDSLFPITKSLEQFIIEEAEESLDSLPKTEAKKMLRLSGVESCDRLKKGSKIRLTATNKASIILAIDKGENRYLFTGDAGIESFKLIPDWQNELKNLFFLKVPHHASDNNISKELIELMQPKYAYNTGFKYQEDDILDCLSRKDRNIEVKTTKTNGDLFFNN